ncbi:MAG: hypothetical protein AB1480_17045 [Nitrospirota bacterium]
MSYKNLKLTISDCEVVLRKVAEEMRGTISADDKGNGLTQFSIEIPGKGVALLNIYDTPRGLTLNPQMGKLQDISEAIAQKIAASCETVATKTYIFKSINENLYKEFAEFSNSEYTVFPHTDDNRKIIIKVSSGKADVTITWFKSNHTLMVQGRTTPLWDEMILWFADKLCENPTGIIEIVFDAYETLSRVSIKYDDKLLEKLLQEKIENVYGNSKILKDYEIKWLKTSIFLLGLNLDLPEYYPCISSAIKVVEGMLRRICISKFGPSSFDKGRFAQFEESPTGGGLVNLKGGYKSILKNPDAINYVERLYNFMRSKRHPYTHNLGIAPAELTNKKAATEIFEELVSLIKESSKFTRVLF